MIVYATHRGGKYLPLSESFRVQPEGKRNLYVNITNRCDCSCTFCLRQKKKMAEASSLWLKREPTEDEVKAALDGAPWEMIRETVFCGFGEPTSRLDVLVALLRHLRQQHPDIPSRLNTNGLGELAHGREIASLFHGILDTVSISLNASSAEKYLALTRAKYGIRSYEAMLAFAERCKAHVPHVVLTIVDHVNPPEEIEKCRAICEARGLTLRVRAYESE